MHTGPEVYHFILHARQTLSLLEEIVAAIKINFFILKMVSDNELDMSLGNKDDVQGNMLRLELKQEDSTSPRTYWKHFTYFDGDAEKMETRLLDMINN